MSILPRQTVLGPLEIVEVFDVFDFPRLFLVQSIFGVRYLVLSVAEDGSLLDWLYLPVTSHRLGELQTSRLTLRGAFTEPEGPLLHVRTNGAAAATVLPLSTAPPDWLPAAGEYLAAEQRTPVLPDASAAAALAHRTWRDVAAISFTFGGYSGLNAPLRPLSELLSALQQGVDTFAAAVAGTLSPRGPLPSEVLTRTQLQFANVFESSFGITVSASVQSDLFGGSMAGSGLSQLAALIDASSSYDSLADLVRSLGPRAAARYRVLVESLDAASASLDVAWASPVEGHSRRAFLGREGVSSALEFLTRFALEEAPAEVLSVRLVGANTRTKTFEVNTLQDNKRIVGRISDEALSDVDHATLNDIYRATLRTLLEVNSATGEERTKWLLVRLEERAA